MIYDLIAGLDSPIIPGTGQQPTQPPESTEENKSDLSTEQRLLDIIECLIEMKLPVAGSQQQQAAPVPQYYSFMLDNM